MHQTSNFPGTPIYININSNTGVIRGLKRSRTRKKNLGRLLDIATRERLFDTLTNSQEREILGESPKTCPTSLGTEKARTTTGTVLRACGRTVAASYSMKPARPPSCLEDLVSRVVVLEGGDNGDACKTTITNNINNDNGKAKALSAVAHLHLKYLNYLNYFRERKGREGGRGTKSATTPCRTADTQGKRSMLPKWTSLAESFQAKSSRVEGLCEAVLWRKGFVIDREAVLSPLGPRSNGTDPAQR